MVNLLLRNFYYKIFACHKYGHGIHSPYVYNFVINVLNNKNIEFKNITNLIKTAVLSETSSFNSSVFNKNSRFKTNLEKIPIKKFLRDTALPLKYGYLLNNIIRYYNINDAIELGTGLGISSFYMLFNNNNLFLHTVEGNKDLAELSYSVLYGNGFNNFKIYNCSFNDALDIILPNVHNKDKLLFFIDGDHKGEQLKHYTFRILNETSSNNLFIVIDDIRWSKDMYKAWKELVKSAQINLSLDLGRIGILIRKPEILRQHFMIRY